MDNLQGHDYKTKFLSLVWKISGPMIIEFFLIPSKTKQTKQNQWKCTHRHKHTCFLQFSVCKSLASATHHDKKDKWKSFHAVPSFCKDMMSKF